MRSLTLVLIPSLALFSSCGCGGGALQKSKLDDKVTTISTPHTAAECDALAAKPTPKGKCGKSIWFSSHLGEIAQREKEVKAFTPERTWFVKSSNYDHLKNSISPTAREKWLTGANAKEYEECPSLQAAYCKLALATAEKLPTFQANTKGYPHHDSSDEDVMKTGIRELENHTIYYMGVEEKSWLVEKNWAGVPINRYKHGIVWVRYPLDDHPFCRIYYINLVQDYSGGGSYGDTTANFVDDVLVGCPAK